MKKSNITLLVLGSIAIVRATLLFINACYKSDDDLKYPHIFAFIYIICAVILFTTPLVRKQLERKNKQS